MTKSHEIMKEKKVFPLLLSMSVPIMLSMLIQSLYNIIDSLYVTQIGNDALTAVSLAFPLQNIVLAVSVGMGIGISSIMAIYMGAGNKEKANKTASVGIFLVLCHCVVFIILGLFITKPFLSMFTDDEKTLSMACDYTYIILCFSFGMLIQMSYEKIFQGMGKMILTMCLMASGCVVNIILDPILIFGYFGLPAMGVKGAAIATVVGQIFAMIMYLIFYYARNIGVKISFKYAKPQWKIVKDIYKVGIAATLVLIMPSLLTGILNGLLMSIAPIYVAVFGLYYKLQTFINLPACGVVQGMRPIISFNYGATEYGRVKETIKYSVLVVGVIMVIGTLISLALPSYVLNLFNPDENLLKFGVEALRVIGISFLLSTVSIVASGVFEGLGKGKISLLISSLRQLIILVPLAYLLAHFFGAVGVWVAFPVAEAITLLLSILLLIRLGKRELSKDFAHNEFTDIDRSEKVVTISEEKEDNEGIDKKENIE